MMIKDTYEDAFTPEWLKENINPAHELVILRKIIPWQIIIGLLTIFYNKTNGPVGRSLRVMVALLIIARLRGLSDREVVKQVKENRYIQYFCNVPNEDLQTFIHYSSLCKFRKRIGVTGMSHIENAIFKVLRNADVIVGDYAMIDSTVLESNIIYPNDVQLINKAFKKMKDFAMRHNIPLWWDDSELKKLWRGFNMDRKGNRADWLATFNEIFIPALEIFNKLVSSVEISDNQKVKAEKLVMLLDILEIQTVQKLNGEKYIKNRLVSLDDPDARPIKKGKSHPVCEFGTTQQLSFNRDGFIITLENFIGSPNDKILYPDTIKLYIERMSGCPDTVVTDLGYRSKANLGKNTPDKVSHIFMGRSSDVSEDKRTQCQKARSATEGFIATAKNLRGFGKSMWHMIGGHKMWGLMCQTAYNLKKFLQLWLDDRISEKSMILLGLG